jgi:NADH-quinone oxidoreductase subunit L
VLELSDAIGRLDSGVHDQVEEIGRSGIHLSHASDHLDSGVHASVGWLGQSGLRTAASGRRLDQDGIDGVIAWIVDSARRNGSRARSLQTGLVHRELLLAVGGAAVMLIVVLLV